MKKLIPFFLGFLLCFFVIMEPVGFSSQNAATVILLKGKVAKRTGQEPVWIKEGEKIEEGATISTSANGAAKLLLEDRSQINLGPNSSIQVESKGGAGSPAMIEMIRGQVRTKVTTDLMEKTNSHKTKFILRTRSATMGVRGTDFQAVFNPDNQITSLVTFEGEVAMAKMDPGKEVGLIQPQQAEQLLTSDRVVHVVEGNFSSANPTMAEATIPTKLSPAQFESLKSADVAVSPSVPGAPGAQPGVAPKDAPRFGSPVPPGVDAKNFIGQGAGLERQLSATLGGDIKDIFVGPGPGGRPDLPPPPPPEGFLDKNTGAYAPPAGGFLDIKTGLYIPPPPGSAFDPNTGVYVPPPIFGNFDPRSGEYVPPPGLQLDPNKGFVPIETVTPPGGMGGPPRPGGPLPPGATPPAGGPPGQLGPPGAPSSGPGVPGGSPGGPGGPPGAGPYIPPGLIGYGDPTKPPEQFGGPRFDYGFIPHPGGGPPPPLWGGGPGGMMPPPNGMPYGDRPPFPGFDPNCPNCGPLPPPPPPPPVNNATALKFSISVQ